MGFIRAYSARDMGDPFRLRVPKKLKKLKVGRALGSLARAGVGFIPGVGGILSSIIPGASPVPEAAQLPPAGQEWDEDNPGRGFRWVAPPQGHPAWGFARSNGWDMGDPKVLKRKMAAAGPKAKANRKANARAAKASGAGAGRLKGTSARGGRKGNIFSGLGGKVGSVIMGGLEGIPIAGGAIAAGEKEFNFGLGRVATRGGGGRRRSMNPTNVHALKRGLRRIEGFEKLVKRIEKQYPRLKRASGHTANARAGHKPGCRCVACK